MSVKQATINYIKTMSAGEKAKTKTMLAHSVICGRDYAIKSGIDPSIFSNELKAILEGNE